MSVDSLRTGNVRPQERRDPRSQLVREKYFSIRPQPLERWLWDQGVAPAAERVFWRHFQEGLQRGDWCSEIPIKQVASDCRLDVSTVTRAYQHLQRLGCLRRTDPGRDPRMPFQQATALTEVRVPRELLCELDRHRNRRARTQASEPVEGTARPGKTELKAELAAVPAVAPRPADPFAGLAGRERLRAVTQMEQGLSATEARAFREAQRQFSSHMSFDADTKTRPEQRGQILQWLAAVAFRPSAATASGLTVTAPRASAGPRKLSAFELARLRRDLQNASSTLEAPELLRQVTWSIEEGALKRFSSVHAMHIALKKIREGQWTRPHRMPPNWARALSGNAVPELCTHA